MLNDAQTFLATAPHLAIMPGLAIALTVLAFNLLGDGCAMPSTPACGSADMLALEALTITYRNRALIDGLSFTLAPGETLGLVGESGSGKSMTALAIMGLLPAGMAASGAIRLAGAELLAMPEAELCRWRGRRMAMVFQEPMTALNPVMPLGRQIAEGLILHGLMEPAAARKEAVRLMERVGLPEPSRRVHSYPHELSGGQRQRAMIAMAVACRPDLLIADEPTSALDVSLQVEILALLRDLRAETGWRCCSSAMISRWYERWRIACWCSMAAWRWKRAGRGRHPPSRPSLHAGVDRGDPARHVA